MTDKDSFLGRGWAFPVEFSSNSKQVLLVEDEEDIRQSLIILLNTTLGERVMRPKYGANMEDMIFEALNVTTATIITNRIKKAILFHEPRIKADEIDLRPDYQEGTIEVIVNYTVLATNNRKNLVYPYFIIEATDTNL